jgi:hypothetical protein
MIFDPATSALLGEQTVILDASSGSQAAPGTVVDWAVYLDTQVVDSLPADPGADEVVPVTNPPANGPQPRNGAHVCHDAGS